MKKILFVNTNKAWGGGEKWHFKMASALRDNGHNCFFVTYPTSELETKVSENGFPFCSISVSNLSFLSLKKRSKLRNFIKNNSITDIFINLPSDVKIITSIKASIPTVKLIYRRGMPHPIRATILNKYFYNKLDLIIANSLEIKNSIIKNIPTLKNKVKVVYNGVDSFIGNQKNKSETFYIGNLSRLVEQKGHHHILKVAKLLKNQNIKILLGGIGPLEHSIKQNIQENGLKDHIELLGHVNPVDFFNRLDLFLFPSHFEGSANALIEAAQFGVASIAFNISSMPEMIRDQKTGFLIKPFDEEAVANKIIELINDSSNEVFNQENCKSLLTEKFLFSEKVTQIEEVINEK